MDKMDILKEIIEHLIHHQGMGLKSDLDEFKKPKKMNEIDVEVISPIKDGMDKDENFDDKVNKAIEDSHDMKNKPEDDMSSEMPEMTDEELEELSKKFRKG